MTTALTILFWSSILFTAYVFVGYPLVLALRGKFRPKSWKRESFEPTVSIVMAAYNEALSILPKIDNLLALDYPADRFEVLVGSDGSTDATPVLLEGVDHTRVRVFSFPYRRGKPSILNALVPEAKGDIVVLADVRQKFDRQVLRTITQAFADPDVGAVTGELILTRGDRPSMAGEGSGFYWRYEKFIRSRECVVDSTVVVTGAIYAIRKELFERIPADTIVDDLVIPLNIARRGYRVVVEREARAYDVPSANAQQEFKRKVRTIAGAFQTFSRERWLFNPLRNRLWWQTMSHKVLRLLVAPWQLSALLTNVALARFSPFFYSLLVAQTLFYCGALAGCFFPRHWKRPAVVAFPYIFCLLSCATVLAFIGWITHRQTVMWDKTLASSLAEQTI